MTQGKMVYTGTRRCKEKMTELAKNKKRKDCRKSKENVGCSNNTYEIQMMLEDKVKCAIHTFTML
jgi:hypothetical protein